MDLWLRFRNAQKLEYDKRIEMSSEREWSDAIHNREIISSILWPTPPLFKIGQSCFNRRHPHEKNYKNGAKRNISYLDACKRLTAGLMDVVTHKRCLVYAPLRGAYPIWRTIQQFLGNSNWTVYYPVTSSFVFYPTEFGITNKNGRPGSGRYNNIQELERLKPFLEGYDYLVYLDEIVSGGMMRGHLQEMLGLGIDRQIQIVAVGLADKLGERSELNRAYIKGLVSNGRIHRFICEGCAELITEDQKFLLGVHYLSNMLGPNVIPVLNEEMAFHGEKTLFERDVLM
jgi:hypothetical protein